MQIIGLIALAIRHGSSTSLISELNGLGVRTVDGDRRCSGHSGNCRSRGWIAGSNLPIGNLSDGIQLKIIPSLQVFFQKANLISSKPFKKADMQFVCAGTAPMTRLHCDRHK